MYLHVSLMYICIVAVVVLLLCCCPVRETSVCLIVSPQLSLIVLLCGVNAALHHFSLVFFRCSEDK